MIQLKYTVADVFTEAVANVLCEGVSVRHSLIHISQSIVVLLHSTFYS